MFTLAISFYRNIKFKYEKFLLVGDFFDDIFIKTIDEFNQFSRIDFRGRIDLFSHLFFVEVVECGRHVDESLIYERKVPILL